MEDEYRLKRKLEILSSPLVREMLEDGGVNTNYLRGFYSERLAEIQAEKARVSKWRQLDIEEAIENEKKIKK